MEDILRVQDLIRLLEQQPLDAPALVAVVKYPSKFEMSDGWDTSSAVEVCPVEGGEVYTKDGQVLICVELTDYTEEFDTYFPGKTEHS